VEVVIDLIFCGIWIVASSRMVVYNKCPLSLNMGPGRSPLSLLEASSICKEWIISFAFGFLAAGFHMVSIVMGTLDIAKFGLGQGVRNDKHIMFAHGNWKFD
jgi:hypothetical protein